MKRPLISDEWVREFHCPESTGFRDGIMLSPLTFCGTLEELYKTIARGWNDDTREKYDRDFNNVILPHLDHHNEKISQPIQKEIAKRHRWNPDRWLFKQGTKKKIFRNTDRIILKY